MLSFLFFCIFEFVKNANPSSNLYVKLEQDGKTLDIFEEDAENLSMLMGFKSWLQAGEDTFKLTSYDINFLENAVELSRPTPKILKIISDDEFINLCEEYLSLVPSPSAKRNFYKNISISAIFYDKSGNERFDLLIEYLDISEFIYILEGYCEYLNVSINISGNEIEIGKYIFYERSEFEEFDLKGKSILIFKTIFDMIENQVESTKYDYLIRLIIMLEPVRLEFIEDTSSSILNNENASDTLNESFDDFAIRLIEKTKLSVLAISGSNAIIKELSKKQFDNHKTVEHLIVRCKCNTEIKFIFWKWVSLTSLEIRKYNGPSIFPKMDLSNLHLQNLTSLVLIFDGWVFQSSFYKIFNLPSLKILHVDVGESSGYAGIYYPIRNIPDQWIQNFEGMKLENCTLQDNCLNQLRESKKMKVLGFNGEKNSRQALINYLNSDSFRSLKRFSLRLSEFSQEIIDIICNSNLEELDITALIHSEIVFRDFPSLKILKLCDAATLYPQNLYISLQNHTSIESLSLNSFDSIILPNLVDLESLEIVCNGVIGEVPEFKNLKTLVVKSKVIIPLTPLLNACSHTLRVINIEMPFEGSFKDETENLIKPVERTRLEVFKHKHIE